MFLKSFSTKNIGGPALTWIFLLVILSHTCGADGYITMNFTVNADQDCPQNYDITNPQEKYNVFIGAQACVRTTCTVTFSVKGILHYGYDICIEVKMEADGCTPIFQLKGPETIFRTYQWDSCDGHVEQYDRICRPETLEVEIQGSDFCYIKGHATARLGRKSDTFFLIPYDDDECSTGSRDIGYIFSGQIISSYHRHEGKKLKMCRLKLYQRDSNRKLCITFDEANFSTNGAKLVIESSFYSKYNRWEFSSTNPPPHKQENCLVGGGFTPVFSVYLIPDSAEEFEMYDHEFAMSYRFAHNMFSRTNTYNKWLVDYKQPNNDGSTQSTILGVMKKIGMGISGPFGLFLLVCLYRACCKGKIQTSTQLPHTDPGLGDGLTRSEQCVLLRTF